MVTAEQILQYVGWLYLIIAVIVTLAAFRFFKKNKIILVLFILGFVCVWPLYVVIRGSFEIKAENAKLNIAMKRFDERCKTAGEIIKRVVHDVDRVILMKWRDPNFNGGQFALNDPYGRYCGGESCVTSLLFDERMVSSSTGGVQPSNARIYKYVDVVDSEKNYIRYFREAVNSPLVKKVITEDSARYGIIWEDISSKEDREHWIAGGSLKIIDKKSNEIIAEHTGFLIDKGLGNVAGFRDPWADAYTKDTACPSVRTHGVSFITKVLNPKK